MNVLQGENGNFGGVRGKSLREDKSEGERVKRNSGGKGRHPSNGK